MTPSGQAFWERVKEVFTAATESVERDAFLARLESEDPALLAEVRALLDLHDAPRLALDSPPGGHRLPGECLAGRFRITRFLASGGMGEVYAGFDEETGAPVALKFIAGLGAANSQAQARFRREVEMARKIEHPNVCRTFDLADHGGEMFCVMELLEGRTLSGGCPPEDLLRVALQLCDGLEAAHQAGVIHRDLKPGNVFLEAGRAVLIDFGLAAAVAADGSRTATSAVIGTLAYLPPEILAGEKATVRSDLYSLGVVLYEMLTGRLPHDARSPFRLAAQKAREAHRDSRGGSARLTGVWTEVLDRCLKARPEQRYASAAEVKRALLRRRPSVRYLLGRKRAWIPGGLAALVLLGASGYVLAARDYQPRPEALRLYDEGLQSVTRSAPLRAAQRLEEAVKADPRFVKGFALLAAAYAGGDQLHKAREAALRATAVADRRWWLGRGERAALEAARATVIRDYAAAAEPYRRLAAAARGLERIQTLLTLADTLDQAGRPAEASQVFSDVLRESPGQASARLRLATLLARRQDSIGAVREFAAAEGEYLRQGNEEGLADLLLARASLRLGTPESDQADAQRVLDIAARQSSRYHRLSAQFLLAAAATRQRRFEAAAALMSAVTTEAQHEGFLTLAARAQSEYGNLFIMLREPARAEAELRIALRMAEESGSLSALAQTRMRIGEALNALFRAEEAVRQMQPAIEWYRGGGFEADLPLILIKWGTALHGLRAGSAAPVFEEALERATIIGDELYQAMALQRLASMSAGRDLPRAAAYAEKLLPLARRTNHHGAIIQTAHHWLNTGQHDRANEVLREGERMVTAQLHGVDRRALLARIALIRADTAWIKQDLSSAAAHLASARAFAPGEMRRDIFLNTLTRRVDARLGRVGPSDVVWARRLQAVDVREWIAATEVLQQARDLPGALRVARHAVDMAQRKDEPLNELEATLLLHRLSGAPNLTARIRELARRVGFDPPERFGGRADLLALAR